MQGAELKKHVDATLGKGNVYEAVRLPEGEDIREWLAVNTVDMYNAVSALYMMLQDYCSDETCPTMSAGHKVRWPCCAEACRRSSTAGTALMRQAFWCGHKLWTQVACAHASCTVSTPLHACAHTFVRVQQGQNNRATCSAQQTFEMHCSMSTCGRMG